MQILIENTKDATYWQARINVSVEGGSLLPAVSVLVKALPGHLSCCACWAFQNGFYCECNGNVKEETSHERIRCQKWMAVYKILEKCFHHDGDRAGKANRAHPEIPVIRRCHDYRINTKYIYECVKCGYQWVLAGIVSLSGSQHMKGLKGC